MSVPIIENWSDISGIVSAVIPASETKGFAAVEVEVHQAHPVEGYANLLARSVGSKVVILIPEQLLTTLKIKPGDEIACRARLAKQGKVFVHREHVSIQRS